MHEIRIMDVNKEKKPKIKWPRLKNNKIKVSKTIQINDNLFEIGLRKGLIEKNSNNYYFVGDQAELLAFKNEYLLNSIFRLK